MVVILHVLFSYLKVTLAFPVETLNYFLLKHSDNASNVRCEYVDEHS
jgi:hypothetical protein